MSDEREHKITYHMNKLIGYQIEIDQHIEELAKVGIVVLYSDNAQVRYFDNETGDYKTFYKKI